MNATENEMKRRQWLVRTPGVFADLRDEVFSSMSCVVRRDFGGYRLVDLPAGASPLSGEAGIFVSWCLPVHHAWPCDPGKMDGFVEKAASGLQRKFADAAPQALWVGAMEDGPAHGWFKRLASNVRGRALQLFPGAAVPLTEAGAQDPECPALFCLIGKHGLFAGMASPRECNGFYPGGVRYLPKAAEKTISRAGAKLAEALHHGRLFGTPPGERSHWLELGASPGGMTAELLHRGAAVTAVDRAALDERLSGAERLIFVRQDVATFQPPAGARYDALLCDMNGEPLDAMAQVLRLSKFIRPGAWIIFTLKTTGGESYEAMLGLHAQVLAMSETAGLRHLGTRHLSGNRREFTLWFTCC